MFFLKYYIVNLYWAFIGVFIYIITIVYDLCTNTVYTTKMYLETLTPLIIMLLYIVMYYKRK